MGVVFSLCVAIHYSAIENLYLTCKLTTSRQCEPHDLQGVRPRPWAEESGEGFSEKKEFEQHFEGAVSYIRLPWKLALKPRFEDK